MNIPTPQELMESHEGRIPYLYLDILGLVTGGVGHMFPNPNAASVAFGQDMTDVFNTVKGMAAGMTASHYKYPGCPQMTDQQIDDLLDNDIALMQGHARQTFPNFDTFTNGQQLAIIDALFEMGPNRFAEFHNTIAAINRGDWQGAAAGFRNSAWYSQNTANVERDIGFMLA
jgi:GH24 family phage-related lysozyme (muramidase)